MSKNGTAVYPPFSPCTALPHFVSFAHHVIFVSKCFMMSLYLVRISSLIAELLLLLFMSVELFLLDLLLYMVSQKLFFLREMFWGERGLCLCKDRIIKFVLCFLHIFSRVFLSFFSSSALVGCHSCTTVDSHVSISDWLLVICTDVLLLLSSSLLN